MSLKPAWVFLSISLLFSIHLGGIVQAQIVEDETPESMTRIMMLPPDAEVTGLHVTENGILYVNAMHPDEDTYKATIGVMNGIDWHDLPRSVPELPSSSSASDIWHGIRTSYGEYQVLMQSGDALSQGGVAGGLYTAVDGSHLLTSEKPDYNAFVPLNTEGSYGYLYTAWEDRPAGLSQMELLWNASSLQWDVLNASMLDLSSINGGWVFCFGSLSPWGSPLFSEELYFTNTKDWNDETYTYHADQERLATYLGFYPNPYDYGYIVEVDNSTTNEPDYTKHHTMGRFSHENAQVMPDLRTVYLSDDGYDTVLFKFIADEAGELDSGTLYAAQVDQDESRDSSITGFDVNWVELASSSNAEIEGWIDDYDGITTADFTAGQNAYISDEEINDWAESRLNVDLNNDGTIGVAADDRVAFLESRKAAAALGASDEWNKMEGVAFNPNAPEYLYLAMSDVRSDMSDGKGDIDVTQNRCGIVYQMSMGDGWDINRIDPIHSGGPYSASDTNQCDINNLAGPDNIVVLDDGRVLIGEDTGKHQNNMLWLWSPGDEITNDDLLGGQETIRIEDVMQIGDSSSTEAPSEYVFSARTDDLQSERSYTAIINLTESGENELKGFWLWNNFEDGHTFYNQTFSIPNGCYQFAASLYERNDFAVDAKNATVLNSSREAFTAGEGTCSEGVYTSGVDLVQDDAEVQVDSSDSSDKAVPGFGVVLSMCATFLAFCVAVRRQR